MGIKSYEETLEKSIRLIKSNLVLFVPNILMLAVSFGLAMLLVYFLGLVAVIKPELLTDRTLLMNTILNLVKSRTHYVIFYLLFEFLLGCYFTGMKYGMIKDVLIKGKTTFSQGLTYGRLFYKRVLVIHILSNLIIYLPILFIIAIYLLFSTLFVSEGLFVTAGLILLAVLYLMFIGYRLLYIYPVMTFENEGVFKSFKDDFHYIKTHVGNTFLSWVTVALVFVLLIAAKSPTELIPKHNVFLGVGIVIILLAVEMVVSTWEHLFIFKSYLDGRK